MNMNYIGQAVMIIMLAALLMCEIKRQPQIKEVPVEKVIRSIEDSLMVIKLERKLKRQNRYVDSLVMAHIRKDGLLQDPSSYIKTIYE